MNILIDNPRWIEYVLLHVPINEPMKCKQSMITIEFEV